MFGLNGWELLVVLVVMLLLFGSRLPNVMRSLGRSATEFKKGMNEITDETFDTSKSAEPERDAKADDKSESSPAG